MSNYHSTIMRHFRMKPTAKYVLYILADMASVTGECYPKISTLVDYTGLGRTAVCDALKLLKKDGYILEKITHGNNRIYTLGEMFCETIEVRETDYNNREADIERSPLGEQGSPLGVPQKSASRTSKEAPSNHQLSTSIKRPAKKPPALSLSYRLGEKLITGEDMFEQLWNVYPDYGGDGKRGAPFKGDKKKAKASFEKILKEKGEDYDYGEIISKCEQYSDFCGATATTVCHVTTWLNQRRWENDYSYSAAPDSSLRGGYSGGKSSGGLHQVQSAAEKAKAMLGASVQAGRA